MKRQAMRASPIQKVTAPSNVDTNQNRRFRHHLKNSHVWHATDAIVTSYAASARTAIQRAAKDAPEPTQSVCMERQCAWDGHHVQVI